MAAKILVIEDHPDVRDNIAEILELSSYKVITAADGKEGVRLAKSERPDLILCDIMMPGLDGYEVLYILGKNHETASIPFVFLTAKSEKEDFRKGMSMGADDYLVKPFEEIDLLNAIENRLRKYEQLKGASNESMQHFVSEVNAQYPNIDLSEKASTKHFKKGEIVYKEEDFPHYLYQIKKGKVKCYKINSEGKEFIIDILGEGDFMGQLALIQDVNHTEFAQTLEDTELQAFPRQDFQSIIYQKTEVAAQFIKLLSKDLVDKEKELMAMAYDTVRKRTADALVKMYDSYKNDKSDKVSFPLNRNDLASIVGTATESAIRMLSEFKKDGWISVDRGDIEILEIDKLRQVRY